MFRNSTGARHPWHSCKLKPWRDEGAKFCACVWTTWTRLVWKDFVHCVQRPRSPWSCELTEEWEGSEERSSQCSEKASSVLKTTRSVWIILLNEKKFVKSTCDIKKEFFLHVIYPRVWIITKQTKRWNMSLGLEEMPPGSERVLCRPQGQRASRLTMQHITPSSSSECTLGKSFFSSHLFWDYEYFLKVCS